MLDDGSEFVVIANNAEWAVLLFWLHQAKKFANETNETLLGILDLQKHNLAPDIFQINLDYQFHEGNSKNPKRVSSAFAYKWLFDNHHGQLMAYVDTPLIAKFGYAAWDQFMESAVFENA